MNCGPQHKICIQTPAWLPGQKMTCQGLWSAKKYSAMGGTFSMTQVQFAETHTVKHA